MDHNSRIEAKIDKLDERLDIMAVQFERYNLQLEIHMKRTDMLESFVKKNVTKLGAHIEQVRGAGKLLGLLALLASIFGAVMAMK